MENCLRIRHFQGWKEVTQRTGWTRDLRSLHERAIAVYGSQQICEIRPLNGWPWYSSPGHEQQPMTRGLLHSRCSEWYRKEQK